MQNLNRRDALKLIGASATTLVAGSSLARAADAPDDNKPDAALRAKAHKNFKLGIFTDRYDTMPVDEAARRIKEDGFSCVVLQFNFKDVVFDPFKPDWEALKKIRTALDKHHVEIAGLFGYHNVIDPDEAVRKRNDQLTSLFIKEWKRFGSPIISTETGTFNPKSQFDEDPRNFTEEGYKAVRDALAKLARRAEKTKAVIAIEGYWRNVIGTVERAERLFKDVSSPSLKLTMDPCNYYRNEELPQMDTILRDMFKRIGRQTVIAHAKDVKARGKEQDLPAAGLGVMNYPLYLRLLAKLDRPMPLLIEHLEVADIARARDFVKAQIEKI